VRRSECVREADILEALQRSQWPDYCSGELREHVRHCTSCRELVEVATALLDEHHHAVAQAPVPSSGIVWWRAQMRARQEGARAATRPITVVQGLSLACAAGLLAAVAGFVSPEFRGWMSWAVGAAAALELPAIAQSGSFLTGPGGLPLALYLTFSE
jgi:hypothetical protein